MTNKLYLIATPIGNIEDITLRARRLFKDVDCFFAEDTREFHKLLGLLGVTGGAKKVHSYSSHNMKEATDLALTLLKEGKNIGLVTDRGTPAVSDPGAMLVREAVSHGFMAVPIPGPSSATAAFSVSGLDGGYTFIGFFPKEEKERKRLLEGARAYELAIIFFESPQRIRKTAAWLKSAVPGGAIFIAREMTKVHEEYRWIDLDSLTEEALPEMGEYCVILKWGSPKESDQSSHLEAAIAERLLADKPWAKLVAERLGVASSVVYNQLQREKEKSKS